MEWLFKMRANNKRHTEFLLSAISLGFQVGEKTPFFLDHSLYHLNNSPFCNMTVGGEANSG